MGKPPFLCFGRISIPLLLSANDETSNDSWAGNSIYFLFYLLIVILQLTNYLHILMIINFNFQNLHHIRPFEFVIFWKYNNLQ